MSKEVTTYDLFYERLYEVYKLIHIKRSFWSTLEAINKALSALRLNLDNLDNLNRADVYNLLLFARMFQRHEMQERKGIKSNNAKIMRLNKQLEELAYLSESIKKDSVKR